MAAVCYVVIMKIQKDGINYEINIHYGLKSIVLTSYKEGERDYIEHSKPYTMAELFMKLPFIAFGTPEYCLIQEIDAHCDTLKKCESLKSTIELLNKA